MNAKNTVTESGVDTVSLSEDLIDEDSPGFLARTKRKFGKKLGLATRPSARQQIRTLLAQDALARSRDFSRQERSMLHNILRFDTLRVDDVMLPRADIVAIDEQASLGELFALFETSSHSRIPLFRETLDDPRGMVHIKDLMLWIARRPSNDANKQAPKSLTRGGASLHLVEPKKQS